MTTGKRVAATVAGLLAATTVALAGASAVFARSRAQKDSGTIDAAITHVAGTHEFAAGAGQDKLFGSVALTLTITPHPLTSTTGRIVGKPAILYTATGSLRGTMTAIISVTPAGNEKFSDGKLSLTHGSGSLAGHRLTGIFSGGGNRNTGQVMLHYKATYLR